MSTRRVNGEAAWWRDVGKHMSQSLSGRIRSFDNRLRVLHDDAAGGFVAFASSPVPDAGPPGLYWMPQNDWLFVPLSESPTAEEYANVACMTYLRWLEGLRRD